MSKRVNRATSQRTRTQGVGANKQTAQEHAEFLSFSYKYLDLKNGKFCCRNEASSYFVKLFERKKELSRWRVEELQKKAGLLDKSLRFHSFDFRTCTEPSFGLPSEDQLVDKPWQFGITANEYGRVHGFFIGSTFYVRWLDPGHLLDPRRE
jgi:hypothetical protein